MRLVWLGLVLAAGCGEDAPPPITPEPAPREAPAPETARAEAPRDEGPGPIVLPSSGDALRTLVSGGDGAYLAHDDPRIGTRVGAMVRALARRPFLREEGASATIRCTPMIAHPRLVSLQCENEYVQLRGAGNTMTVVRGHHFTIAGGELRPFAFEDAFTAVEPLAPLVRRRCAQLVERRVTDPDQAEHAHRRCDASELAWVLGPNGPIGTLDTDIPDVERRPFAVPWAEVRDLIREDGPLAYLFAERRAPPPSPPLPAGGSRGFAVSGLALPSELAIAWSALPAELRSAVHLAAYDELQGRLVVDESAGRELAERAARALGSRAVPASYAAPGTLHLAVTTEDVPLRDARGLRLFQSARGTLVVAVEGEIFGARRAAAMGRSGGSLLVAVDVETSGFMASRYLRIDDGCRPPLEPFLTRVPEARRARAATTTFRARVETPSGPAVLFVSHPIDEVRVGLAALSASCAVGAPMASARIGRPLWDARFTATAPRAGDVLLVVGALGETGVEYAAYRGQGERVWTATYGYENVRGLPGSEIELETELAVGAGDDYRPIVIDGVELAWRDGALVDANP